MSLIFTYLQMMQKSTITFNARMIVNYYNMHWLDYRVGLKNGCLV